MQVAPFLKILKNEGSNFQGQVSLGVIFKNQLFGKIYPHICNPGLLVYILMTGLQLI